MTGQHPLPYITILYLCHSLEYSVGIIIYGAVPVQLFTVLCL
jgi:hypothetical protein